MTTMSRSTFERLLSDALRDEAVAAPMPDGLLRVPDRWVRSRTPVGPIRFVAATGVVVAAVVGTLAVVGLLRDDGLGPIRIGASPSVQGVEIRNFDTSPRDVVLVDPTWPAASGPIVEVARGSADGRAFRVTAFRGSRAGEVCIVFDWAAEGSAGCGPIPPHTLTEAGSFGPGSTTTGSVLAHEGVVSKDVAAVWVEMANGARVRARLVDLSVAEIDAYWFIAFLPGGTDATAWVATGAAGREIDRFTVGGSPVPTEPAGPQPTPEAPGRTWVMVVGPRDWVPPEAMSLEIGDSAWPITRDGGHGVVSIDLRAETDVRLFGLDGCRLYASLRAEPGALYVIRLDADASASVEEVADIDAGPGLIEGEPSGCG